MHFKQLYIHDMSDAVNAIKYDTYVLLACIHNILRFPQLLTP